MAAFPYPGLYHTYKGETVDHFSYLKKESGTIHAKIRKSHAYSMPAAGYHDREKAFLPLNTSYISQIETQNRPSQVFLERQILPPDFLVVLQLSNRPSKAHLPFLQDI